MTSTVPLIEPASPKFEEDEPLLLRPSTELAWVPAPRAPAGPRSPARPSPSTSPIGAVAQTGTEAQAAPIEAAVPAIPASTWLLTGMSALAGLGWVLERRRRRLLQMERDSVLWADGQPSPSIMTSARLTNILPDNPSPAESARAIYVTAIGDTTSRREATLIDLHQLDNKLNRRRDRGNLVAAVLLLQQHLADFRYTSPWAFLELRELYKVLGHQKEWEIARQAFRNRFGQNAPTWEARSTEHDSLLEDKQLCAELVDNWPYREARLVVWRWMLGEHEMRQKNSGPPLLKLGVYRDMVFLDRLLDGAMLARPEPVDSLL